MRIISGKFRGKKLVDSDYLQELRPTTDANRESLFNIISNAKFIKEINFKIDDKNILDVCCGSGSVGFECLSRGAKSVFFIDKDLTHLNLAKKNAKLLNVEDACQFLASDVKNNLPKASKKFDFIFIDPPYAEDYLKILTSLNEQGWLAESLLIVVEFKTSTENQLNDCGFLKELDRRKYGLTTFVFFGL